MRPVEKTCATQCYVRSSLCCHWLWCFSLWTKRNTVKCLIWNSGQFRLSESSELSRNVSRLCTGGFRTSLLLRESCVSDRTFVKDNSSSAVSLKPKIEMDFKYTPGSTVFKCLPGHLIQWIIPLRNNIFEASINLVKLMIYPSPPSGSCLILESLL